MIKDLVSKFSEWAAGPYSHTDKCVGIYYSERSLTVVRVVKESQGFQINFLDAVLFYICIGLEVSIVYVCPR